MVERHEQPDVLRQQHPVAEHVPGHVADAHHGEVLGLGVDPQLAEVPLDRLPGAARGDAHRLVVVADRAAGGERVAEPEPVVERHLVGDVGEGGGALVRGHHQVGVVAVEPDDLRRRHDLLDAADGDQVVGDVEQAADEGAVAGDALGQHRLAVGGVGRRPLHDEAALGAHRDDDGVLHHLRLDQAEHLGAEVLPAVGPAQPTAGDRAEPQVHAFDPRAVDPDLEPRPRGRQVGHLVRVELERDVRLRPPVRPHLVVAGAQGGQDGAEERPQDAVLVQARDGVQRAGDLLLQPVDQLLGADPAGRVARRVEPRLEQRRPAVARGGCWRCRHSSM